MADATDANNIASFETMVSRVTGYGADYDPSNGNLALVKLQTVLTDANAVTDAHDAAEAAQDAGETDRENLFKPLGPTTTRAINYYASTGTADNKLQDAKEFKRKLTGGRAKPITPPAPGEPEEKHISVSQQGYVDKVEHLDGMIGVFDNDGLYAPNENDIKIAALQTYSGDLKDANSNVIDLTTATKNAELALMNTLYDPVTGMCERAALVKKYVSGRFGATSLEYKQISGLKFRKKKKKT